METITQTKLLGALSLAFRGKKEKKKGRRQLRRSGQEGHGHPSKPPGMVQKGSKRSAAP